jgi:hypothetical protein
LAGATLNLSDSGKWGEVGPPPQLINSGTVIKSGPAAVSACAPLSNAGLVRVEGGTLKFESGGTHTGDFMVLSGAKLGLSGGHTLSATADISGSGSVTLGPGSFTTAGAYSASGTLSVAGAAAGFQAAFAAGAVQVTAGSVVLSTNSSAASWWNGGRLELANRTLALSSTFTQVASGTLALRMDGGASGQFGRVAATGAISLSGSVEVSWGPGYRPTDATPFDITTGSTRSGQFTSSTIQSLGVYRTFTMAYLATAARLWVYAVGIEGP